MPEPVLEIRGLSKRFGTVQAVSDLSLTVASGTAYGILGPNGSGKTTTMSMLLGILRPDAGTYSWFGGMEESMARKRIGALLETPNFYPWMDAEQNLRILAHIKKVDPGETQRLLELVGLTSRRHSPFKTFSLGMKQRLALAGALVGDPDVLILDEPANGLDPQGISEVRSVVRRIAEMGKTILMASHILDEVEKVCSHVAILKNGRLLAHGTTGSILDNRMVCEAASEDMTALKAFLENVAMISHIHETEEGFIGFDMPEGFDTARLNRQAFDCGIVLSHLVCRHRSLETEFLKITNSR